MLQFCVLCQNLSKHISWDLAVLGLGDIPSKLCREVDFWVHSYISRGKSPGGDFLNEISRNKLTFGHLLDKTS